VDERIQLLFKELAMREIIRPEVLWREVIPLAVVALIVLLVFAIARTTLDNQEEALEANFALDWTMRAFGAFIAVVAAFGLFWRALNGDPLDLQFSFVLALLAGLLLVDIHWSLAIVLGAIGVAMLIRGIWVRSYPAARASDPGYTAPVDRPLV
jgi:hypothetical protein